jgi:TPR repeat protein
MMRKGVPKDDTQAATWFRKAADQGEAGAQSKLLDHPTQPIADARIACFEHDG